MAEISVVIVAYRTPELLRGCLERLTRDTPARPREILVVDNASGDATPEVVRAFPEARLLQSPENRGYAGGVNRGLAAATGRYVLLMNPDVEVRPGSVDRLAEFLDAHPETGIAAPKLLNSDGSLQYSCRRHYTLETVLLRRTVLGKLFPRAASLRRHLMMDYDHASPRAVDWVAGAAMMVRREAIQDVGPMEERYFLYFEDVDWCTRMQARGWRVHYVPEAVMVHHWQRASLGFGRAARRHLRSGLRFYDRWGGLVYLLRRNREALERALLVAADLIAFAAAFLTAYLVRQELAFALRKPLWSLGSYGGFFVASMLVYTVSFQLCGLHRRIREGDWVDVAFRVGKGATLAALVLMATTFILDMRGYSRLIVLGSWPLVALFAFLDRRLLHAVLIRAHRDRWNLRRLGLVGEGALLDRLAERLALHPELGWDPVRIRSRARTPGGEEPPIRALSEQLSAERISVVVVSPESLGVPAETLAAHVLPLRRAGFGVRLMLPFLASLPPQARMEPVADLAWLSLDRPALRPDSAAKRGMDLLGALLYGLLALFPVLGWGLGRRLAGRPVLEPKSPWRGRWGDTFSGRRLAGGGWLRAYPLLGAVFRGSLSLVGPRPLDPEEDVPGGAVWEPIREHYRPGLTGPWALSGPLEPADEMRQELGYLENWSLELDLKLLVRTALGRRQGGGDPGSADTLSGVSGTGASGRSEQASAGTGVPAGGVRR